MTAFDAAFEKRVYSKVTWHLIPFLFLCYIFAYVDRVNVGFAKLQMQRDLNLSDSVYGFGAGISLSDIYCFRCLAISRSRRSGRSTGWGQS